MNNLFAELKRRNIFRVAGVYAVVGWLIMQVISVMTPALNLPDWVDSFFAVLIISGFPICLLLAWAFELTPEGMKPTKSIMPDASISAKTGRKLDYAILGGLALVGGLLAMQTFKPATAPTNITASQASDASIAVLPFVNLSSDPDQEYFSDGISEELLNLFAKIPNLHVTSRSSAFAFKGKDINIPDVARQLGVAHVLEGSVRKSGSKLRITAQLIEAESDRHLWSETYDRELDDIFAIQDEISAAIVFALHDVLGVSPETSSAPKIARTVNQQAYEAYLRGNAIGDQRTKATKYEAIKEYQKAIKIDPEYAPAYAALAATWLSLQKGDGAYGDLTLAEIENKVEPLLQKALALDPNFSSTYATLGRLQQEQGKFDEGLKALKRSIELNPNDAHAYNDLAIFYQISGEADKITGALEKAYELDPINTRSGGNLALLKIFEGKLVDAEEIASKVAMLDPNTGNSRLLHIAWERGDIDQTEEFLFRALEADPSDNAVRTILAHVLAFNGFVEEAIQVFPQAKAELYWYAGETEKALAAAKADLVADPQNYWAMRMLGNVQLQAGNIAEARKLFEQAFELTGGVFEIRNDLPLYWLRKKEGDIAGAEALLPKIRQGLTDMEKAGWVDGLHLRDQAGALMALGDTETALSRIQAAANQGARVPREFIETSILGWEPVFDDPRWLEITAISKEKDERFVALVFTRACTPPDEAYWQPSVETCARAKKKYGLSYTAITK